MSDQMNAFAGAANIVRMSDVDLNLFMAQVDYGEGEVTHCGAVQADRLSPRESGARHGTERRARFEVQAPRCSG